MSQYDRAKVHMIVEQERVVGEQALLAKDNSKRSLVRVSGYSYILLALLMYWIYSIVYNLIIQEYNIEFKWFFYLFISITGSLITLKFIYT